MRDQEKSKGFGIPYQTSAEVRDSYIQFFKNLNHQFVPSAPVVPHDDPTLLFANSGMNQFKPIFLGDKSKGLKRAVNSQKCLRVSGKHNDLDEVGRDTYHHTFFEMLGNWSFGDYYKEDAIVWAWKLLTEIWKFPKDRLFASVYKDDDEAFDIWRKKTDIAESRILRFGNKDNFWEMGEIGPCGPCSEIHFDLGDDETREGTFADKVLGVNGENDRYLEIWNLVFMQYERRKDGSLKSLVDKHVDTGMGFERVCAVIQGKSSNYDSDVFAPLIGKIVELSGVHYDPGEKGTPHRVVVDHLRALSFAIADGATPGNEGRGYVLRRILRRASRFAGSLNQSDPFIFKLVPTLVEIMGQAFPDLVERQDYVSQVIEAEESRFMKTLRQGMQKFDSLVDETLKAKKKKLSGEGVFTLHDTFGFPKDLTKVLAEEKGLEIDDAGYETQMQEQRERARNAAAFDDSTLDESAWIILDANKQSEFVGYDNLTIQSKVMRYLEVGDDILVVLDKTPFYSEGGGQVGDRGVISSNGLTLKVVDCFKTHDMHIHKCVLVEGLLAKGTFDKVTAAVDEKTRRATFRNHSATHLLQSALRQVLGTHIQQQGSRVDEKGLRFDFTHQKALSAEEIEKIENLVNEQIMQNLDVVSSVRPIVEAKAMGALALFGEKYGDTVRVIEMEDFSVELCGGTHVSSTGEIGSFRIVSEGSIAAGVRRIEALTGHGALQQSRRDARSVSDLSKSLKVKPEDLVKKVEDLSVALKAQEKRLQRFELLSVNAAVDAMIQNKGFMTKDGTLCIVEKLAAKDFSRSSLNGILESFAAKLNKGAAVLTHAEGGNLSILAAVGTDLKATLKANEIIKSIAHFAGGRGGGRPDRAQAGSKEPEKEPVVLSEARKFLENRLS